MQLSDPVQFLKGIGPRRATLLRRLAIETAGDLLAHYPRDYEDRRQPRPLSSLIDAERVTVRARVVTSESWKPSPRVNLFAVEIDDGTARARVLFFRKSDPYRSYDAFATLRAQMQPGAGIWVCGMAERAFAQWRIHADEWELVPPEGQASASFGRIVPVYSLTAGITQKQMRMIQLQAGSLCTRDYPDTLPDRDRTSLGFMKTSDALRAIHFPERPEDMESARRRLAFNEFLLLELALALSRRAGGVITKRHRYQLTRRLLTPFREALKFSFTADQRKVINEIFVDLQRTVPMRRLLMGDVGAGKTVVALSAILLAVESGHQAALLAPTEILAGQHYLTLQRFLASLPVNVGLVTAARAGEKGDRSRVRRSLRDGTIDIAVGTHALLEADVRFRDLSLIVIDEQHRFGVMQRAALQLKADRPDVLLMTATPIPRSLALTIYGDMDVSVIAGLPPGRVPVVTMHCGRSRAHEIIKEEIGRGHQAYVVYPLIEESDKSELKAAVEEAQQLSRTVFAGYRVGLLHGNMPPDMRGEVMRSFRDGAFDILIATTVIEVGIDVPNATVILIEHADRFGLATLHQLRGRVGRGTARSQCLLAGMPRSETARRRFEIMLSTTDGFKVAEHDLSLRGPGEFMGTAQHGLPQLKAGNLIADMSIIEQARAYADRLLAADPALEATDHLAMKVELESQYGKRIGLAKIG